ncbi:MAG TPA: DUF3105 domain-containing protein [Actinophytocola sp.]|nr:DUF3105 domain-containing protein [Actinophytocola sp.]HET9141451.1 DUF3105 domain-containing protein [Actinophytocola sp.]
MRVVAGLSVLLATACSEGVAGQPDPGPGSGPGAADPSEPAGAEQNRDPSTRIAGVVRVDYPAGEHTAAGQRVAYDKSPPFGGPHDPVWADCTGIVYPKAVRNEHMVHALEHGTVWIAYHPDQVTGAALDKLESKVEGQQYLMLSPYPGLDRPISLQSWGHQLKLDSADDARIDQFIKALRANQYQAPEPGARCDTADPTVFDVTNPPPLDTTPPGPDAMPVQPR